jgi:hypothetical protein
MRAVDPIGSRGKSMVQTALPIGRYAARTFRGRSNGYPRKSGSKPSDLCESSRALSGRAAGISGHVRAPWTLQEV